MPLRPILSLIESSTYILLKKVHEEVLVPFDVAYLLTKVLVELTVAIVKQRLLPCDDLTNCTKWPVDNVQGVHKVWTHRDFHYLFCLFKICFLLKDLFF